MLSLCTVAVLYFNKTQKYIYFYYYTKITTNVLTLREIFLLACKSHLLIDSLKLLHLKITNNIANLQFFSYKNNCSKMHTTEEIFMGVEKTLTKSKST